VFLVAAYAAKLVGFCSALALVSLSRGRLDSLYSNSVWWFCFPMRNGTEGAGLLLIEKNILILHNTLHAIVQNYSNVFIKKSMGIILFTFSLYI